MFTTYNENGREARYVYHQMATTFGAPSCQSFSAHCVDAAVSAAMLEAISPSAIEVSLQVAEDIELERLQLHSKWKQRLERAAYGTAFARRALRECRSGQPPSPRDRSGADNPGRSLT
jgi:hypothetical protein